MSTLSKSVMRKVYLIWLVRTIFSPTKAKAFAAVVLFWQFSALVSIPQVVANWQGAGGSLNATFAFFESAFANTETMTLVLLAGIAVVCVWLARDLVLRKPEHAVLRV